MFGQLGVGFLSAYFVSATGFIICLFAPLYHMFETQKGLSA